MFYKCRKIPAWIRITRRWLPLFSVALISRVANGDIHLPSIFSDHMVLQQNEKVPFWGKAAPGEHVRVTINGKMAQTDAGTDGRWKLDFDLKNSPPGPFDITVEGKNRIVIRDAVVGEVWLASGQSNMELPLRVTTGADAEIAESANPRLRQFRVKRASADHPLDDCIGQWTVAGPETSGDFTAIGYYFGKDLVQDRKTPVGIIDSSQGGSYIEPWTPADALDRIAAFKASADALRKQAKEYPVQRAKFGADFTAWLKDHGRQDKPCPYPSLYAAGDASAPVWSVVILPSKVPINGFPGSGVFWIRHDIDVSALLARQGFKIMIGPLEGYWQVYWNGAKLTEMTYSQLPGKHYTCYFPVPPEQIRPGTNTLAIRIFSPTSPLVVSGNALWAGPIVLDGKWLAKVERAFPALSPDVMNAAPKMTYELPETVPGGLFNAMINPIIPYSIAGVLWYQGENNVARAWQYRIAFPTLIKSWRDKWRNVDLPFYFCQVSNNAAKISQPGESAWAELRDAQSSALALPNTAEAVTIDLGEAGDPHYRDKKTVGDRLFLIAKAKSYGDPVPCFGPVYKSMAIESGTARLNFRNTDGGLIAKKLFIDL